MPGIGSEELHKLIGQLQSVRNLAVDDKNAIVALYSTVDPKHDARITAFSKTINVFNSLQLGLAFISKHLLHKQWWSAIATQDIPDIDKQIYVNEFANLTKIGFIQGIFSAVESSLRLLLRALDPTACNGGLAEFKSVYECLFKSNLTSSSPDAIALLDLLRLVRNTIHNNGVYFHPSGNDVTAIWKGNTYAFKQGKPIDFVTWELLIVVSNALRLLLRQVVEDAKLQAITTEIPDPFSY